MDTTAATMHPAEEYLRNEQNPPVLYVRIYGERRKLFINRGRENVVGIIAKGKRKHGYIFSDWSHIEKIYYPSQEKEDEKDMDRKMILKYQKLARLATHTLKSATKLFSVLLASKRPLITELADKLRLKYPLLPTISPCPTMRLEAIRSIIPISCRRYPKSV